MIQKGTLKAYLEMQNCRVPNDFCDWIEQDSAICTVKKIGRKFDVLNLLVVKRRLDDLLFYLM